MTALAVLCTLVASTVIAYGLGLLLHARRAEKRAARERYARAREHLELLATGGIALPSRSSTVPRGDGPC